MLRRCGVLQWTRVQPMNIRPTEIDPFDQVAPVKFEGNEKMEIADIMRWRDPRVDAQRAGTESTEPTFQIPAATPPSRLTYSQIGQMYRLDDEDLKAFFQEGVCGNLVKAFAPPLQPRCFLYRKQSHMLNKYIEKMEAWQAKEQPLLELRDYKAGFIFDGPRGCGKSVLLNQAVHFARSRDMLVFYVPDASEWTSGSFVVPSTVLPGFYDNPNECLNLMKHFCKVPLNKQILSQRKLSRAYDMPTLSGRPAPQTVWDLLNFAFDDIEQTVVVFKFFLDELLAIDDIPVLFVVDSYDALCKPTEYFEMHEDVLRETPQEGFDIKTLPKERIHASQLVLGRALNFVAMSAAPNRLMVTATCRERFDNAQAEHDFAPFDPKQDTLLHTMEVDEAYDDYELRTVLRFYLEAQELTDEDGTPLDSGWSFRRLHLPSFERMLYKTKFITNNNPYLVWHTSEMKQYWEFEYDRQRQMLGRKKQEVLQSLGRFKQRARA